MDVATRAPVLIKKQDFVVRSDVSQLQWISYLSIAVYPLRHA